MLTLSPHHVMRLAKDRNRVSTRGLHWQFLTFLIFLIVYGMDGNTGGREGDELLVAAWWRPAEALPAITDHGISCHLGTCL